MKWTIGDVTVTRVVELQLRKKGSFLFQEATPEQLRAIDWLSPRFIDEIGDVRLTVQSFIVRSSALLIGTHFAGAAAGRVVANDDAYRLAVA